MALMHPAQDLPPRHAYWHFPTVFWFNSSDTALLAVPAVGGFAALLLVLGGPWTPFAFLIAYLCLVSVHEVAIDHYFPWDSLLLESLVLCCFLPPTNSLLQAGAQGWAAAAGATVAPTPLLSFLFRWLLFRMMWGFGKLKFSAHTSKDDTYIKNFFLHMPIASPLGWFGFRLPDAAHVANLTVMWLVEIPLPFLLFAAGLPRLVAALGYLGLMAGIHVTGNFGYFNVLTAVLTLPQLAHGSSLLSVGWGSQGAWTVLSQGAAHIASIPSLVGGELLAAVTDALTPFGLDFIITGAYQGIAEGITAASAPAWAAVAEAIAPAAPALAWAAWAARIGVQMTFNAPAGLAYMALVSTGDAFASVAHMAWTAAGIPAATALCGAACVAVGDDVGAAFSGLVSTAVFGGASAAGLSGNSLTDTLSHTLLFLLAVGVIAPLSILNLPFNSWITVGWPYWPTLLKAQPAWLVQNLLAFVRTMLPFRIVHSYGVFPPHSAPGVRWVTVYEGSSDGKTWRQWEWPATITHAYSPPRFIAPYMPRKDHDLFYESNGMGNGHNFMKLFGTGNPYRHTRSTPWHRIQARLLQGAAPGGVRNATLDIFANNPFPDPAAPPAQVRCSLYMYEPTSVQEWWASGRWWKTTHAGYNLPAATAEDAKPTWDEWLSPPEAWWGEAVIWKRRAGVTLAGVTQAEYDDAWAFILALRRAAAQRFDAVADAEAVGGGPTARILPLDDVPADSDAEARLPATADEAMDPALARQVFTWDQVHEVTRSMHRWYSPQRLRAVELTLGRLLAPLQARLEAVYLRATPTPEQLAEELQAYDLASQTMPTSPCAPGNDSAWDQHSQEGAAAAPAAAASTEDAGVTANRVRRMDPVQSALVGTVTSEATSNATGAAAEAAWRLLSAAAPLPYAGLTGQEAAAPAQGVPDWRQVYACLPGLIEQPVVGQAPRGGFFTTPFKIASYAQWYLLVGGRDLYERAVGGQAAVVGGHKLPLVWPPPAEVAAPWAAEAAFEAAGGPGASLPHLFRTTCTPHLNASHSTPESAFYLMSVLHYDTLAMHACKGRLNWALKRHAEEAPAERPGSVTPGFIDLMPDVREKRNLRLWDPVAARWTPTWIVPGWEQGREDGEWVMQHDGTEEAGRSPLGQDVVHPEWGHGYAKTKTD